MWTEDGSFILRIPGGSVGIVSTLKFRLHQCYLQVSYSSRSCQLEKVYINVQDHCHSPITAAGRGSGLVLAEP